MLKKTIITHSQGLTSEFWVMQYHDYYELFGVRRSKKSKFIDMACKVPGKIREYKFSNEGTEIVWEDCHENLEDWPIRSDVRSYFMDAPDYVFINFIAHATGKKKFNATIPQGILGAWKGNGIVLTFKGDGSFTLDGEHQNCMVYQRLRYVSRRYEAYNAGLILRDLEAPDMMSRLDIADLNEDTVFFYGDKNYLFNVFRRCS